MGQRVRGVLGEFRVAITSGWHVLPSDVVAHTDPLTVELVLEVAARVLIEALLLGRRGKLRCADPAAFPAEFDELRRFRVLFEVDGHVVFGLPAPEWVKTVANELPMGGADEYPGGAARLGALVGRSLGHDPVQPGPAQRDVRHRAAPAHPRADGTDGG